MNVAKSNPLETAIRSKIKELIGEAEEDVKSTEKLVDYLLWLATTPIYKPNPLEPATVQKKKLINWSLVPIGAKTAQGEILARAEDGVLLTFLDGDIEEYEPEEYEVLRLVPKIAFTHLPKGTPPPVVPGLVIEYEYWCYGIEIMPKYHREVDKDFSYSAYRVIGVAEGFTDDPKEAV
jgi:hypothetical protein